MNNKYIIGGVLLTAISSLVTYSITKHYHETKNKQSERALLDAYMEITALREEIENLKRSDEENIQESEELIEDEEEEIVPEDIEEALNDYRGNEEEDDSKYFIVEDPSMLKTEDYNGENMYEDEIEEDYPYNYEEEDVYDDIIEENEFEEILIYPITADEYREDNEYGNDFFMYYEIDNVLVDSKGVEVNNPEDIIGSDYSNILVNLTNETYIRNENTKMDYEIFRERCAFRQVN